MRTVSPRYTYENTLAMCREKQCKTNGGFLLSDHRMLAYCPVCDVAKVSVKFSRISRFNRKHLPH